MMTNRKEGYRVRSKSKSFVIENASIVTPEGVLENASITVVDGTIAAVGENGMKTAGPRIDGGGSYVLPGLIDLHGDALEEETEPQPGDFLPLNVAVFEIDKKLAACGITTMYHAVAYASHRMVSRRNNETADHIVREVSRLAPCLSVRTRIHARFDITNAKAVQHLEKLIWDGSIQLFSIMDHTPGQGQFKDVTNYGASKPGVRLDEAALARYIELNRKAAVSLRTEYIGRLVDQCRALDIPVASHDDDSEEKLDIIEGMGIRITEFPVNLETAASAFKRNMHILYGSPNILRGVSTGGNLSAREAIKAGYGGIICSDYAPTSIVHAIFALEKAGIPLHEAVNMASLNPARAAGISGFTGSLEQGKSADLIIVDTFDEVPRVLKTFVEGREVYSTGRLSPNKSALPAREDTG
jgi:alpha-D-ribose 1-methylphosphonate 5-triphosphate diphosphatase